MIPKLLKLSVTGLEKELSAINNIGFPMEIKLLSFMGVFLLLYVRYNIRAPLKTIFLSILLSLFLYGSS
jgi:hypothetical protein